MVSSLGWLYGLSAFVLGKKILQGTLSCVASSLLFWKGNAAVSPEPGHCLPAAGCPNEQD